MGPLDEPEVVIDGGAPVARQLEAQIRRQILQGTLRPGEELPTVRGVAVGLAVNPRTVEEAYRHLKEEGFLTAGEGCGPRIAPATTTERHGQLEYWCRDFLRQTASDGHSLADVLQVLHACIDRGYSHGESY
jgi:GntR family transcriptional regulator